MSTAAVDIYCHACSRTYPGAEYTAVYNEEQERVCPECSSEFVEIREAQVANLMPAVTSSSSGIDVGSSRNAATGTRGQGTGGTTSTRRVFTTPDGLNMELHITTAMVPPEVYDILSRNSTSGVSMMFQLENGSIVSASNLRNFMPDDNFDALLDRLAQAYRPPIYPTPQHVIDELPRRRVAPTDSQPSASQDVQHATCRPGEPCPVCHDEFQANTTVIELPCQHCFHDDCILPWLREHNTCPVCRFKLANDDDASPSSARNANRIALDSFLQAAGAMSPSMPPLATDSSGEDDDDNSEDDDELPALIRNERPQPSSQASGSSSSSSAAPQLPPRPGTGSSPRPVRTSTGSGFMRAGPYNRLDEGSDTNQDARRDAASGPRPSAAAAMRLASSTLAADLNNLVARHQELRREAAEARQVTSALQEQLDRLLQRHTTISSENPGLRALNSMAQAMSDAIEPTSSHSSEHASGSSVSIASGQASAAPGTDGVTELAAASSADSAAAAAADDATDSPAGRHMTERQLQEFREEVDVAAELAEALLAVSGGQPVQETTSNPQESAPAVVEAAAGPAVEREHVIVALEGAPMAVGTGAVAAHPVRVPIVLRLIGGVLRWAFRSVGGLFRMF